jgi:hypothetical protein
VGTGCFADPLQAAHERAGVSGEIIPDAGRAAGYAALLEIYREARSVVGPLARRLTEVDFEQRFPPNCGLR